jgi:hypothetical protein
MKKLFCTVLILLVAVSTDVFAQAESTNIVVRALAKDAKFIGSSMEGVHVKIKEVETGDILAEGLTKGSTGNTDKLVRQPHKRYEQLSTAEAAKYETTLSLQEPTFVEVSVTGPMVLSQSKVTSSTQLWLIPGKDITGDGIILEIPGFAIDILDPKMDTAEKGNELKIKVNAVMMCGCPTSPDGLWDSNEMEFMAVITKEDTEVARKAMSFTGKTSTFETQFIPEESGSYQIMVYGYDPRTGNTGLDKTTITVK